MEFEGKTAIVTGGARGIGRGIALELAQRGSNVVIADMDEESARSVVAEIKAAGTQSYYCETDVTQQWSTDDMVATTATGAVRTVAVVPSPTLPKKLSPQQ